MVCTFKKVKTNSKMIIKRNTKKRIKLVNLMHTILLDLNILAKEVEVSELNS